MSRPVLITAPYFVPVVDHYRPLFERHAIEAQVVEAEQALSEDQLIPLVGDVEGIICGDDQISARVIEAAPRLRVIAKWGTGIDAIDHAVAVERGISVCNTPGAFNDPVADTVLAYVLCFARRTPWMDREVRAGRWTKLPGLSLAESVVGIVGCGNIGRAVAKRARAFGVRLIGTDPSADGARLATAEGVEIVDLDQLLTTADFVTLHVTLNESTERLIGGRELDLMKPTACLINTSRGRLVDEAALVEALRAGIIGGAGLDVYEVEPLPADSPLRGLDNVLLAPHNANSSPAAWEHVHESTVDQLIRRLAKIE